VPPKLALAEFIGDVKGNSSHYVNHVIKPDLAFYWQNEYGQKRITCYFRTKPVEPLRSRLRHERGAGERKGF
jgi:hypothetical protein